MSEHIEAAIRAAAQTSLITAPYDVLKEMYSKVLNKLNKSLQTHNQMSLRGALK